MEVLKNDFHSSIDSSDRYELSKMTPKVVKEGM